jgi:hypothetical protein
MPMTLLMSSKIFTIFASPAWRQFLAAQVAQLLIDRQHRDLAGQD